MVQGHRVQMPRSTTTEKTVVAVRAAVLAEPVVVVVRSLLVPALGPLVAALVVAAAPAGGRAGSHYLPRTDGQRETRV